MAIPSVPPPAAPAIALAPALELSAGVVIVIDAGGDDNRVPTAILAHQARVKRLLSALVDKLIN